MTEGQQAPISDDVLKRYVLGQCNDEERNRVERWLQRDEWEGNPAAILTTDEDRAALRHQLWKQVAPAKMTRVHKLWFPLSAAVAILLILAVAAVLSDKGYFFFHQPKDQGKRVVHAERGKRLRLTLDDGTRVWLNSESTLSYPVANGREITLTGEAVFDVAPDQKKAFVVHTLETSIRVLGTRFNVRAYPMEGLTQVAVMNGRVRCETNSRTYAGEFTKDELFVMKKGGEPQRIKGTAALAAAWSEGTLLFDHEPLKLVIERLERWYNVRIHFQDSLKLQERYRGAFENPSLQQVLNSLSFGLHMRYTQRGNDIYFSTAL